MKRFYAAPAVCLALFTLTQEALAQVATGNIRGTVMDASEAVMANAKVTLANVSTGLQPSVTTNESGDFNAPSMPLGDYQITAEAPGFQRKVLTGISLQVDQTATIRIVLDPCAMTQSIEVSSAAPLLESQTSSIGQVVENKRIIELLLNGRNPFALWLLAGGTTLFYGLTTNLPFVGGGGRYSANDILLAARRSRRQHPEFRWQRWPQRRRLYSVGRCCTGVQGQDQQLRRGVWPLGRLHSERHDPVREQ